MSFEIFSVDALALCDAAIEETPEFIARFLLLRRSPMNRKAGAEMRGRLQTLGVLRDSGHEHFNGSIVIPIFSLSGDVLGMYGRKITPSLREGTPLHLYLPGPHRGVWNEQALEASQEIILCESLIDALTFWCAGFRNVTASYGVGGFTDDHKAAFQKHCTRNVWIAYDRDEAGDAAAERLKAELEQMGIGCHRVLFPRGMDANDYASKVTPAAQSLAVLLNGAEWLAKPEAPPPPQQNPEPPVEIKNDEITIEQESRRYRIRGLAKNLSHELLKVNVLVSSGDSFHIDTLDLYSARQRAAFTKQASEELNVKEETLKRDLGRVLLKLEELQDEQIRKALDPAKPEVEMTDEDRAAALDLLKEPKLLDRILADFERCGIVGEETNKLVAYLAVVSRHLDAPLAIVVQSSSAAGKSSLMDAVLAFVPEEERVQYSAMTGQSLYYMGEMDLKHKVLAIVEEEGAARASYALKLLQSEGALSIASTGKDPSTGKLVTHQYRVEGPVMIFLTTTAIEVDEELLNRCLVLAVDEDREQTRAIHRIQRQAQTLEGLLARSRREEIVHLHRNAQRLLKPIAVVNPFAGQLSFPDGLTRTRRDHMKFLTLIRAVTLLHQYQRPVQTVPNGGKTLEYIESTLADIQMAAELIQQVLGRSLDELPPQTRRLLLLVDDMVKAQCEQLAMERSDYRFSRRDVRRFTGWSDAQVKRHLRKLEELEYLIVHHGGRGQSLVYELYFERPADPSQPFLPGLADIEKFPIHAHDSNPDGGEADKDASRMPQVQAMFGGGADAPEPITAASGNGFHPLSEKHTDTGGRAAIRSAAHVGMER